MFVPEVVLKKYLCLRDLNLPGEKLYLDAQIGGCIGLGIWAGMDWPSYGQDWWDPASLVVELSA